MQWNGFWSLLFSLALMSCTEGLEAFRQLPMVGSELRIALLGSVAAGVGLNITQILVVKELGALPLSEQW